MSVLPTTIEEIYNLYLKHPRVYIDTRRPIDDSIFIAVSSEKKENKGNHFALEALESKRAKYAIIDNLDLKNAHPDNHQLLYVENSNLLLQKLGNFHRKRLKFPILAIAGSNGKTTTKELIASVLRQKYNVASTPGNLNNQFGVPLSLLGFSEQNEFGVLELGANHLYETADLCKICMPDFGIVTNCGKDHLEGYGSVENVIKANSELYDWLASNGGIAFVNDDDTTLLNSSDHVSNRVYYGSKFDALSKVRVLGSEVEGPWLVCKIALEKDNFQIKYNVQSKLFGTFWLNTILAAVTVGNYFGVETDLIIKAIESYDPKMRRSEKYEWRDSQVILDCYNANPSSMYSFIQEVIKLKTSNNKMLVLGSMLEGGDESVTEHQFILQTLIDNKIDNVILVGNKSNEDFQKALNNIQNSYSYLYFRTVEEAKSHIEDIHKQNNYYFVKGSRGIELEKIFDYHLNQ